MHSKQRNGHQSVGQLLITFADRRTTIRRKGPAVAAQYGMSLPNRLEAILFFALAFCTALRFVALAHQSLWTDELFSVFWAKSGAIYMLSHAADETNPPLYYLLLDLWIWGFGDSESAVRLLSACISTLTILVVFVLGNVFFDRRAGFIAALLFALSAWNLYFAQEARVFSLLTLDFSVMVLSINRMGVRLKRGASATTVLCSLPAAGFLLSAVAAPYLHYVAFPIFVTIAVVLALIWWRDFAFGWSYFVCIATIGTLVALLSIPALALAVWQRHSPSVAWMSFPSATKFLGLAVGAPDWKGAPDWALGAIVILSAGSALIWMAIFVLGAWKRRGQQSFVLIYLLPIIGFCVLTATSLFQPFLFSRTLVWISIPVYLGLAGAVTSFGNTRARKMAAAAVILASAIFTPGYFAFARKEPWRVAVHSFAAITASGDLLILGDDTPATAFVYYHEARLVPQLRRWRGGVTTADKLDEHVTGIRPATKRELGAVAQHGAKLIFVSRGCETPTGMERANANMAERFFRCGQPPLSGWLLIRLFMEHMLRLI
ncbi:MAG: glycosyltransferase family 39 protein [Xanthobacteraceae bacterium]